MKSLAVGLSTSQDIATYVAMAKDAQLDLRCRGLGQWVPAAHDAFRGEIDARIERKELFKIVVCNAPIGYFVLTTQPSSWWSGASPPGVYLSGIVVSRSMRGRSIGTEILSWVRARAVEIGLPVIRLDCHADNTWLCQYYARAGFSEVSRVEQHPGYVGVLYEQVLPRSRIDVT
jgi:RimJ/RimL family protein N-acetyltransferase